MPVSVSLKSFPVYPIDEKETVMSEEESKPQSKKSDETQMAIERTYLSYERTLLAWVRTGTSLVTLGLTLFKFIEFLHDQNKTELPRRLLSARTLGMVMVVIGITTLGTACLQHRQRMRRLQKNVPGFTFSPAYVLALLMSVLGIIALIMTQWNF